MSTNESQHASPLDAALRYADLGWPVLPCKPDKTPHFDKATLPHGLNSATTDHKLIDHWWRRWPSAQVAINCGASGLVVVDLDVKPAEGKDGVAAFARLCDEHGFGMHGASLVVSSASGGRHHYYRVPAGVTITSTDNVLPGSGIDRKSAGGYVIAPSPASPGRDIIEGEFLPTAELAEPPDWLLARILLSGRTTTEANRAGTNSSRVMPLDDAQVAEIRSALRYVCNDSRSTWLRVGMALKSTGARAQAFELWCEWSNTTEHSKLWPTSSDHAQHPKFDAKDQLYQWDSLVELFPDGSEITLGTLFFMAREEGWQGAPCSCQAEPQEPVAPQSAQAAPVAPPPSDPGAFPAALLTCPGLIGDVVRWMLETSPQKQPALCLASTLVTLGAVLGRRLCTPTNLRTNIYALGIGETGCGKDPSISRPVSLLAHAQLSDEFIGPGEWKSDSGLRAALIAHPSHVCLIDEFVKVLKNLSGDRVPPHLLGIKRYILELFSRAGGVHLAAAYADRKVNAPVPINEPNFGIYGVGVPSDLFDALDRGAIGDGFLNRFLVFFVDNQLPPRQPTGAVVRPPQDLVERLTALHARLKPEGKNLAGTTSNIATATCCRVVPMFPQAQARVLEIEATNDARMRVWQEADDPLRNLWNRFAEHVQKVALIRVGGDDPNRAIGLADIEWAHDLVLWCLERTHRVAEKHVADSRAEAETKRVLRIVAAAGARGMSGSRLCRATQWLRRHDRKDVLQTLAESGQIRIVTSGTPQSPATTYFAENA